MTIPAPTIPVPPSVRRRAGDASLVPVWENADGGLTFRVGEGTSGTHIKWGPSDYRELFRREVSALRWASSWIDVPRVVELDVDDADGGVILVTSSLAARSAVDPHWIARPERAVRACGVALRMLHDALPVEECPYSWEVPVRIAEAASHGKIAPDDLRTPPAVDRLVVCHGDPCVPNTFLDDSGAPAAFVDLGMLGIADRWADLAVGSMSVGWNFGPGWEHLYFEGYGIEPDAERIDYYRRLWDAT
ncbi:kanamycin kinase [Labedella gwakjiensis]|uniref:Aminoglycoside 3'-phosphotransferase n=1 Tax=Labedella gwakjiensis TaxID=390269 RepID=A0A2P8H182_9MICO|nr:aminoglycoside 3'-phosphotransferase [Labedella gwakjiensis]PSL39975.1 kanamycin kinase [Labedella gwakjiensis]RUQ85669.1 aminoglycoside 3'-phosphotransferase [Labedella gwakjiensis]